MSSTRQLAAIMFTDIVGYTALMGEDERKAFDLLRKNRQVQRPFIEQYGGRWIKELGDGVLASFATATDAVSCACAIQQACGRIPGLQLRIGIHLGDIVFEHKDVFGDGVNIASRLQALAPVGGIWVSEAVYKNVINKKEIRTEFIQEETLKNVREPVRIYEVSIDSLTEQPVNASEGFKNTARVAMSKRKGFVWGALMMLPLLAALGYFLFIPQRRSKISGSEIPLEKSIAVLYFDNMSGDPAQDYFSDGITEEIIAKLSQLKELRVISRTSVLPYKGKGKNIREIARELACNIVLEGSVRKDGNRVRITAQLIDAAADKHLWSQVYDRELTDIFEIQSSVAESIAGKFNVSISPEAQAQISHRPTANMEAYDLYLQAKTIAFTNKGIGIGNPAHNRKTAMAYLQKAIVLDPSFPEALALLSQMYLFVYYSVPDSKRMLDSATVLAQKAIEYNPKIIDGYDALAQTVIVRNKDSALTIYERLYRIDPSFGLSALGNYYYDKGDFVEAMKYFSQKVRYEPNKVEGYLGKAIVYGHLGQRDSAVKYFERAKSLDPNNKNTLMGEVGFYQFQGSVEATKKAAKLAYSDDTMAYNKEVAIAYLYKKEWAHAEEYYRRTGYRDMDYALVLWKTNRKDSARFYFQNAVQFRKSLPYNYGMDLSRIYAVLGDKENAMKNMQLGFSLGWHWYDWVKNDPYWDEIRNTPEFKKEEAAFDKHNTEMLRLINENEKRDVRPDLYFKK